MKIISLNQLKCFCHNKYFHFKYIVLSGPAKMISSFSKTFWCTDKLSFILVFSVLNSLTQNIMWKVGENSSINSKFEQKSWHSWQNYRICFKVEDISKISNNYGPTALKWHRTFFGDIKNSSVSISEFLNLCII